MNKPQIGTSARSLRDRARLYSTPRQVTVSRYDAGVTRLHVVAAALLADKRVLVARRGEQMREPLKWEFPGGKVERGETPAAALSREISEELGIVVSVGRQLGVSTVAGLELELFVCQLVSGVPVAREHAELRWVAHHELSSLDWAPADVPLLDSVARALRDLD